MLPIYIKITMSHWKKHIKKLTKYVRDDRLDRVKSSIRKYGMEESKNYRNGRNQSWLHVACKYGSKYVLQYLTRIGFDASCCDTKGNLPLHIAARYILSLDTHANNSSTRQSQITKVKPIITKTVNARTEPRVCKRYVDFIEPLIKAYPQGRKVTNKYGVRPKDLLKLWRKRDKAFTATDHPEPEDHSHRRNDDDISWWEKLSDEMYSECYEFQFGDDFGTHHETYDQWASRMAAEHAAKRCKDHNFHRKGQKRQHDAESQSKFEESIREDEMKRMHRAEENRAAHLLRQKTRYESLCMKLFQPKSDCAVNVDNLPWQLNVTPDQVLKVLLVGIDPSDAAAKKKYLREQQIRWHPDKFQQLWSSRVAEVDRDRVLAIVNHLSQIINGGLENM